MKTNVERKYRKQVNKNGWMARLQRFCFGKTAPQFTGYCPFFWFTWFCLLFFPLIMAVRIVFLAVSVSRSLMRRFKSTAARRPKDSLLLSFYQNYLEAVTNLGSPVNAMEWENRVNTEEVYGKVLDWIAQTPDWENCAKQVLLRHQQREEKKQQRQVVNAKRTLWLSKYGGYVTKPLLAIIAIFISYWVVKMWLFVMPFITLHDLAVASGVLLAVLVAVTIIALIFEAIVRSVKWFRKCPKDPDRIGFWRKIRNGFVVATDFIEETVGTIYTRECPLIEWGDESGPITRNGN